MIGDGETGENWREGEREREVTLFKMCLCDNYLKSTKGSPDNLIHTALHLN